MNGGNPMCSKVLLILWLLQLVPQKVNLLKNSQVLSNFQCKAAKLMFLVDEINKLTCLHVDESSHNSKLEFCLVKN